MKSIVSLRTACAAMALTLGTAHASDPIGVYARVDKVVLEPNPDAPERIQIRGVFALAKPNDRNEYQAPQRGYLYCRLPAGREDLARKEWADLKEVAGSRRVVAFGNRHMMRIRVRKPGEKPDTPDVYELGYGVVKVRSGTEYAPVKSLLEYQER